MKICRMDAKASVWHIERNRYYEERQDRGYALGD